MMVLFPVPALLFKPMVIFKILILIFHAIVSDGCFIDGDSFRIAPGFMLEDLEEAFSMRC